jgi:hypothetical protein
MRNKVQLTAGTGRWSALLAGTAALAATTPAHAQWTKHFRVGMQLAINVDAQLGVAGTQNIPSQPGMYDDGYVLVDDTGNAQGVTTYWGYQNSSQYNEQSDTLTFRRTDSITLPNSTTTVDDSPYIGMEAVYGGPITRLGQARLGWEVGYSFLPISISDRRTLNGTAAGIRPVYDTAPFGQPIVMPPAGYNGGPSGEQQPAIVADPFQPIQGFSAPATISGPRTLDVSLHNIRFGPTLHWEFARRWAVQGSAGGAVGLVTGDYIFNETIAVQGGTTTFNAGKIGTSEFVYGGYVNGVVLFHVEEHGDIYAGLQFMTMSDSEVDESGRHARLNLGGAFSFLIGVNWPF